MVHWYNKAAQYWAIASPTNGSYTSPLMKPGTYTMKLYRGEYPVAQDTVTITEGGKTTKDIKSTDPNPSVVWRIGNFDGQPFELKNGDKIERMHPSDVRMGTWGGNYTVGKSSPKDFPMALFAKEGGVATVNFKVSREQAASDTLVLRVGTTLSFKGGRPSVKIGSWQGKDPGAPVSRPTVPPSSSIRSYLSWSVLDGRCVQTDTESFHLQKLIDSRGVTRGAYRGYGEVYTWKVPVGTLREGENTLTLGVSGSGDANFLSANYIVDAIELQGPSGADSPLA